MIPHRVMVKMLRRETAVAGPVQSVDLMLSVDRNPFAGGATEPVVQQARLSVILKAMAPSAERALRNTEQLRRLDLIEFVRFISLKHAPEFDHPHTLESFRPAH
jgi:hypothetical protein